MKREEQVLFIINDNSVAGRTRLQKYGFLLSKQYKKHVSKLEKTHDVSFYKDWKPYHNGPYSQTLADDIEKAVKQNLLQKRTIHGGKDMYVLYSLTAKGREKWREILNASPNQIVDICHEIRFLQATDTNYLLRDIYVKYPEYAAINQICSTA